MFCYQISEPDVQLHFNLLTRSKGGFLMTVPVRCTASARAQQSNEEMNFTLSDWMLNRVQLPGDSDASTKRSSAHLILESDRTRGCTNGARKCTDCTMWVPSVKWQRRRLREK